LTGHITKTVFEFISQLMVRNRELLKDNNSADDADLRYLLTTQAIALNALHRLKLGKTGRNVPHQIVVVGPTQVGKSTLTNILLQQPLAESSAEAGFTVHCQGFHVVQSLKDRYTTGETWATAYFGELQQYQILIQSVHLITGHLL